LEVINENHVCSYNVVPLGSAETCCLLVEFHKHVADDGLQFVDEALQATEDAVVALLKHHLQAYPDLATAAEAAAREVLLTYQDPLYAAVRDVTHSFSYVVETLHSEVNAAGFFDSQTISTILYATFAELLFEAAARMSMLQTRWQS
jgi:hypothetical protein